MIEIEIDVVDLSNFFGEGEVTEFEQEPEDAEITWFHFQLGDIVYIA